MVVDNKAGASGMIAAQAAAKAPADGYTVLITTNTTHAANEHLYKKLSYDPVKDFAPVTGLGKGGQVLVVNAGAPYKSVAELLAFARKNPGKLSFGSGSSSSRMAGEMLKQLAGVLGQHLEQLEFLVGKVDGLVAALHPAAMPPGTDRPGVRTHQSTNSAASAARPSASSTMTARRDRGCMAAPPDKTRIINCSTCGG